MNKTITFAKMRSDGKVVEVLEDGGERSFADAPMRPMTEAEVASPAADDPDARPMTPEELSSARRVPRTRTLRRALGLTQEEFASRFHIPSARCGIGNRGDANPTNRPAPI